MKLERIWAGFVSSPLIRALRRSMLARRAFGSASMERFEQRRRRWVARRAFRREPALFADLDTVCLFVGHVKSGGSLLGAMIDAHPDAILADEVDVLDRLAWGFEREELLHLLARNARREALKGRVTGRRLGGYSLAVPGQWQGRYRRVCVVGETRAGPTVRRLGEDLALLDRLRSFAQPAALRFIHVVRNPLDPIGAMVKRGGRSVEGATNDYDAQAGRLELLSSRLESHEVLRVRYEELVGEPDQTLSQVVTFLGLERDASHISACSTLVDPRRVGERHLVAWSPAQLDRVRGIAGSYPFLHTYRDAIQLDRRGRR